MSQSAARIVHEFSGFRLDPQQRLLLTVADGRPTALTARVFDTLLCFVERRVELLDKATLMKAMLGAGTQAYDVAAESMAAFAQTGTVGAAWVFLWLPEMLPFRQDERFQAFAARLGLPEDWQQHGPPDDCELRDGRLIC